MYYSEFVTVSSSQPPFNRKITSLCLKSNAHLLVFENQIRFEWCFTVHIVQSESQHPNEKSMNLLLHIKYTTSQRGLTRLTWPRWPIPQKHLNTVIRHSTSLTDQYPQIPALAWLYIWSIAQHPPLGCKAALNLQSKNITALLAALNYPAGLPAGLIFPTIAFCSRRQVWQHNYSPCIRK